MKKKKKALWATLFIGPHMILFILFFMIPAVFGVFISLTDWDLYSTPIFVGLDNFKTILFDSGSIYHDQFFNGIKNTLIFVVFAVPLCIVVPLILAILLSTKPKLSKTFQSLFYLPTLFAVSAVMLIWAFQLSISYGPFSEWFGLDVNIVGLRVLVSVHQRQIIHPACF